MVKVNIISGFLGAGKTTLIKKLLTGSVAKEKIILLENEYGEVGVDGSFMKDSGIIVDPATLLEILFRDSSAPSACAFPFWRSLIPLGVAMLRCISFALARMQKFAAHLGAFSSENRIIDFRLPL